MWVSAPCGFAGYEIPASALAASRTASHPNRRHVELPTARLAAPPIRLPVCQWIVDGLAALPEAKESRLSGISPGRLCDRSGVRHVAFAARRYVDVGMSCGRDIDATHCRAFERPVVQLLGMSRAPAKTWMPHSNSYGARPRSLDNSTCRRIIFPNIRARVSSEVRLVD